MESSADYAELEPVTVSQNTEVKIPVCVSTNTCDWRHIKSIPSDLISDSVIMRNPSIIDSSTYLADSLFEDCETADDLIELNALQKMLRDFPGDLFIDRLLIEYTNSEPNLDKLRRMLFDIVKEFDGFPYDRENELKKRVTTRSGDPVNVKLACDIKILLNVMEGEDFSLLKDIISVTRRSQRRKSIRTLPSIPGGNDHSQCRAEFNHLKATIAALQADIVMIKQTLTLSESSTNAAHKNAKEVSQTLDKEINSVKSLTNDVNKRLIETESKIENDVHACKTYIHQNQEKLKSIQESVINLSSEFQNAKTRIVYNISNESGLPGKVTDIGSMPPSNKHEPIYQRGQ
jgi:hypothetical protein